MRRVVRGFWGPRPEPAEALAGRWKRTLDGLTELLPEAASANGAAGSGPWRHVHGSGPGDALPADEGALLGALRVMQAAEGWSDLTGTALRLARTGAPGWQAEISGLGGGAPEFLLQSFVVTLHAPDGAEVPEAELLAVLAREWEPDFGDVSDDDVLDALEDDAGFSIGDPVVGRVGYLSPGRAALVPDSLKAAREELPGGGVLLHIAGPGASAEVVTAYERLREAGALDPLPRPMDRAVL
ncbi:hypothetical protein OG936_25365 [Streptomyces sp. NBC_00846]|uniref:hypothetical protein n=1 Tax=Streptomyces sp. NBC_00846 TaxID=2975849 RepID=UPI0038695C6E|nr:hypothetical protein OG936_25365 [Streptomyces sp. NBC_00846]